MRALPRVVEKEAARGNRRGDGACTLAGKGHRGRPDCSISVKPAALAICYWGKFNYCPREQPKRQRQISQAVGLRDRYAPYRAGNDGGGD